MVFLTFNFRLYVIIYNLFIAYSWDALKLRITAQYMPQNGDPNKFDTLTVLKTVIQFNMQKVDYKHF